MALGNSLEESLVYFGLAEDREYYDDDEPEIRERLPRPSYEEEERPNVRRLQSSRRRRDEIDDIFGDDSASERRTTQLRPVPTRNGRGEVRVHLVVPKSFNDAQDVADKFKDSIPVIINLQSSDPELSKRLIDFASGLTYALDGGMQRIADKVYLLTPRNVEVSAEERAALIEKGFFNQSVDSSAAYAGRVHRIGQHGGRDRARLGRAGAVSPMAARAARRPLVAEVGGEAVASNRDLARRADVVILAHKPAQLAAVAAEVGDAAGIVVSLLAGAPAAPSVQAAYPAAKVFRGGAEHCRVEVRKGVLLVRRDRRARRGRRQGAVRAASGPWSRCPRR